MIHYRVICVNGETESVIYDNTDGLPVEACNLDRQFRGGIEDKVLKFTILPTHPAVDAIHQLTSTIYAYDDNKEVFRGRVANIDNDKYGRQKITCESDMKFLVDVPDVFSMRTDGEPKYYIGDKGNDEDAFQPLHFRERGEYTEDGVTKPLYEFREINPLVSQPEVWSDYHFRPSDAGKTFHVAVRNAATDHETAALYKQLLDELKTIVGAGGTVLTENTDRANELLLMLELYIGADTQVDDQGIIPDWDRKLAAAENYLANDIVYVPQNYDIPLVEIKIDRSNKPSMPVSLLYFGNINLAYDNSSLSFNPDPRLSGGNIKKRLEVERQRTAPKGGPGEYNFTIPDSVTIPPAKDTGGIDYSKLDFCIVHRHDAALSEEVTAGPMAYTGSDVTWVFTTETPPLNGNISFLVKRDTRTTAGAMFDAIFTDPTDPDDVKNTRGYNRYCAADRHIYRGEMPDGYKKVGIDNTSVSSVYQNVEKIANETNTYARIRKNGNGLYVLDFISRNGPESDDFFVRFGKNVTEYSKAANVNNLATAIYPRGVYKTKGGVAATQEIDTTSGITPVAGYSVDTDLHLVIHDASRAAFGLIVQYREYDISGLNVGEVRAAWREEVYNKAVAELSRMQAESVSFDISVIDPRLLYMTGDAPELGNKYPVDIPLFGPVRYVPLVRDYIDMIQPSRSKLTFGDNKTLLSDYVTRGKT